MPLHFLTACFDPLWEENMRQLLLTVVTLGVLPAMLGLAQAQPVKEKLGNEAREVAQGNNVFALDLYAQLSKDDGNIFFSPYSISTALGMTYAGAKGKTAEQMASTLHFSLPQEKLHVGMGELIKHLNAQGQDRPYQLTVANSLWGEKTFSFRPEFINLTETKYSAGLKSLDFQTQTDKSRQMINKWVEDKTNDKIKELLKTGDITAMTKLVLTNAIYFKAGWYIRFAEGGTKPADFALTDGKTVKVPMMQKHQNLPYYGGDDFHAVEIPYKGGELSMVVLLPKKGGLAALEKKLTAANLKQWTKMTMHDVDLKLPKFKTTSRFELKEVLSAMGMPEAFSEAADFSGMTTQGKLMITKVIHKAFIDVHEEGTEAAAATAVIAAPPSAPPQFPKANFHVDQPFVLLIREQQTGSILFMGRITNPN